LSATITPLFQPSSYHSLTLLPGQTSDLLRCRPRATFTPILRSEPNRHFNGSDVCTPSAERISVIGIEKEGLYTTPYICFALTITWGILSYLSFGITVYSVLWPMCSSVAGTFDGSYCVENQQAVDRFFSTVAIPPPVPTFKIFFFYAAQMILFAHSFIHMLTVCTRAIYRHRFVDPLSTQHFQVRYYPSGPTSPLRPLTLPL